MAKITKFGHDAGFFYDLAMQKADINDDIACLDYLRCAQKLVEPYSENDIAIRLEIAETYAGIGLLRESNRELFRIYACAGEYTDEVFYGLVRNFFMNGNAETAAYYLSAGIDSGAIDPSEIDFDESILSGGERAPLKLLKPQNGEYIVSVAKQLMAGNDSKYAKQMLRSVNPDSESYIEATNCIALIELSENNIDEGLKTADRALELDPDDLNSLITKILALNLANRADEIDAISERIAELNVTEWHDYVKLTLCYAETGDSGKTYFYSGKALKITPYERELLLFNAIAAFNLKRRYEAKQALYTLSVLYPYDCALSYHARKIDASADGEKLEFSTELSKEAKDELIAYLEQEFSNAKDTAAFEKTLCGAELKNAVMWALLHGNDNLTAYIAAILPRFKNGVHIMSDALIDPELSLAVKKTLLNSLLCNTKIKRILVVVNNLTQWLVPQLPAITRNRDFINAYWQVYSSLAFIESGFNRKLNIWYKKIVEALSAKKGIKYKANAVAALIAYKSRASKIFELSSYCCEVFDCEMQDFMLYSSIADEVKGSQRIRKARSKSRS